VYFKNSNIYNNSIATCKVHIRLFSQLKSAAENFNSSKPFVVICSALHRTVRWFKSRTHFIVASLHSLFFQPLSIAGGKNPVWLCLLSVHRLSALRLPKRNSGLLLFCTFMFSSSKHLFCLFLISMSLKKIGKPQLLLQMKHRYGILINRNAAHTFTFLVK
jgi:hypothetical protein